MYDHAYAILFANYQIRHQATSTVSLVIADDHINIPYRFVWFKDTWSL